MEKVRRDTDALRRPFEILVIGAGVYGAAIARLAALRGLDVAVIDRGDFCGETSRNSAKLVHGGLRYIQHLDLARVRESALAQRSWRTAAPHLVRPLPFIVPTYGRTTRGPAALAAGIALHELVTLDRNRGVPTGAQIGHGGVMGRNALLRRFPALDRPDVSGGAHWPEAQILDAPRLAFECIEDAALAGAVAVNHAEAVRLLSSRGANHGALVRDRLSGDEIEVRARVTINAAGPWIDTLLGDTSPRTEKGRRTGLTRSVNLVTRRIFDDEVGVGVATRKADSGTTGNARRLLFITPWQDCSIVGTWHDPYEGDPDDIGVTAREIEGWLTELDDALPAAGLTLEDVRSVHVGLTTGDVHDRVRRNRFVDHGETDDLRGLLSIAGVKFTTAPTSAAAVLDRASAILGTDPPSRHARFSQPLPGAIGLGAATALRTGTASSQHPALEWVGRVYGSRAPALLGALPPGNLPAEEHVFRCRIVHGIRREMVVTLGDALFRATDLAERGALSPAQLAWTAETLAQAFGWDADRRAAELEAVEVRLSARRPRPANVLTSPGTAATN